MSYYDNDNDNSDSYQDPFLAKARGRLRPTTTSPTRKSRNLPDDDDRGAQRVIMSSSSTNNNSNNHRKGSSLHYGSTTTTTTTAPPNNNNTTARNVLDHLPPEFLYNPQTADPILHYLPKAVSTSAQSQPNMSSSLSLSLTNLIKAAENDITLHRARVKAGMEHDNRLVRTYRMEQDPVYRERNKRLQQRQEHLQQLQQQANKIVQELMYNNSGSTNSSGGGGQVITQAEKLKLQLECWERALELYANNVTTTTAGGGGMMMNEDTSGALEDSHNYRQQEGSLDWQTLFKKLLDGITDDQEISNALVAASDLCGKVVQESQQALRDTADRVLEMEAAYSIRLDAHQYYAQSCLQTVGSIQEQFKASGKAALQIGHQLELAENKRSQCESASNLIRRWWLLENLAEQERKSGRRVKVEEEIAGEIPANACQMDPLFTKPENSLEASRALKQLRAVIASKRVASKTSTAANVISGTSNNRRFDLTAGLISRTSDALEQRLLKNFESVYNDGGIYDFSNKPRPGSVNWRELRSLAQSLILFDSGRVLHQKYVELVVSNRFPELLLVEKDNDSQSLDISESSKFDMDATRSKLSGLFHRVGEVCTAEFELIAHIFGSEDNRGVEFEGTDEMPLVVARALLQRVISDPSHGLQSQINELLAGIDKEGDFESGSRKLDTFVVIHEKAAGLFELLKEAADRMAPQTATRSSLSTAERAKSAKAAADSLKGFLTSQELAINNQHRQGYINLELRLLHHNNCASLDQAGCTLVKAQAPRTTSALAEKGILEEYRAPVLPLHKESMARSGYSGILAGPLKQSLLLQPLIHATDSLGRTRLMFGTNRRGGETTSRVVLSIYNQMCAFYGEGFLYPIVECLKEMLPRTPPAQPPQLPFSEEDDAPDLGVSPAFWVGLERVHSAAKSFDRELWAEGREDSQRVWEILQNCADESSIDFAVKTRQTFYTELERRGEGAILQALDTLAAYSQWILVNGGESMMATGGTRIFNQLSGQSGGPYAIPAGSSLDTPNSPAVKSLTYCLRVQYVHVQNALPAKSLSSFWTALSMRLYDILVGRILQHYYITTVGAVILSRDIEALRSVAMLSGSEHRHWDRLREIVTLYMTPPDAIRNMLAGPDGETSKGLFAKVGRDQAIAFLSRRNDYRYKTGAGPKKSQWVVDILNDLSVTDPTDEPINLSLFAASRLANM